MTNPGPHPSGLPPCDLVMKGGVTSGVVYPSAVLELSTRYRFQSLGGTSAGAIAASVSAAAEYARQRSGSIELRGLDDVVQAFSRPGFFLGLFAPTAAARPMFDLGLRLARARGSRRRQSAALARTGIAYRPWPAATALIAAIGVLVLLLYGFRHLALAPAVVLTVLAATVLMMLAAWTVIAPLVSLGRAVHHSVGADGFGLCTGMSAGAGEGLTQWLHRQIQHCAGLPADQPLTFAMLKEAGIALQMVATDLGLARPVRIPFAEEQYLFAPAELARLFPAEVVAHVLKVAGVPAAERESSRTWFLPSDQLPVVIGARLSSSVPVLLSSLRLYSAHAEASGPVESYMTDGGLTSNFPIHFFDDWLPSHPTFGLDLVTGTSTDPDAPAVFMPDGDLGPRLPPSAGIHTLGSFFGHVQDASRNWRDELQAELPGFRDRVCQIRMGPGEGGFHLDADPATLEQLVTRGRQAGQEILGTFDWDRHRFVRYLTLMALLRENFLLLSERLDNVGAWPENADAPFAIDAATASREQLLEVNRATVELIQRAAGLSALAAQWRSEPEPSMRVGPRV
ncbi:MAG: patatin [Solirubrobacteraceae bacterium]